MRAMLRFRPVLVSAAPRLPPCQTTSGGSLTVFQRQEAVWARAAFLSPLTGVRSTTPA